MHIWNPANTLFDIYDLFLVCGHILTDCCDGSDEYDGTAICPNTCVMGGNIVYQGIKYDSTARNLDSIYSRKLGTETEDSTYKLIGILLRMRLLCHMVASPFI